MNRNEQIEELLVDWEMARLDGQPTSALHICQAAGCAELVDQLQRRIADLEKTSWIFDPTSPLANPRAQSNSESKSQLVGGKIDRYEILGEVGRGGMGTVYRARHTSMNREVAIKTLSREALSDQRRERFLREIQTIASLNHPNIVTAYDALEHDGESWLVMELVDGEDLDSLVRRDGPLQSDLVDIIAIQIASASQVAHEKGIVHRDIKPSNILLAKDGTAKLLDLGISRIQADLTSANQNKPVASTTLTHDNVPIGTIAFMSPEQALDAKQADARSDIYSLGCTLYWLLTGKPLFGSDNSIQTLVGHRETSIEPLLAELKIDQTDRTRLAGMLAKDPDKRFQSMQQVVDSYEDSTSYSAPFVPQSGSKVPAALATCAMLIAALAGLYVFFPWQSLSATSPERQVALNHQRDLAKWILNDGGSVVIDSSLGSQDVESVAGLPDGPFEISEIYVAESDGEVSFQSLLPLSQLSSISVSYSTISSHGIESLSLLKNLETLSLDSCELPAELWGQLGAMPQLKALGIYNCNGPEDGIDYPELPGLESLHITTSLDDEDFRRLGELPDLKVLHLSETEIGQSTIEFAFSHWSLEELDLSFNNMANIDVSRLQTSTTLTSLYVQQIETPPDFYPFIARLPNLSELHLQGTAITDEELTQLAACKNLNYLDLDDTAVTSSGLEILKAFPSLESLDVANLGLEDADVKAISELKLLDLSLSGNPITDSSLEFLLDTPLESLSVVDCGLSTSAIERFLDRHPTCEVVYDEAEEVQVVPQ